jgi:hypothetical protein
MSAPTRFTRGVTTAAKTNPLGMYGMPAPMDWHEYFNDFDHYTAAQWTVTTVGTGTVALTNVDGGALLITNSAADNDSVQLQKVGESFALTAGKRAIFKARFKVSDATQSDLVMGLCVTDTTLMGATAGAGVTDGIFFSKDDGVATLDVQCQKDATTGQTRAAAVATLANDTFVTVAWAYDGKSEVAYYVNDVQLGTLAGTSAYLPDTTLTVSFGLMNGEAVAKTMTLDYIFAAVER